MSDVNRIITMGIGPMADIAGFILVGLNVAQPATAIRFLTIKRSIALDMDTRLQAMEIKRTITTEAENG